MATPEQVYTVSIGPHYESYEMGTYLDFRAAEQRAVDLHPLTDHVSGWGEPTCPRFVPQRFESGAVGCVGRPDCALYIRPRTLGNQDLDERTSKDLAKLRRARIVAHELATRARELAGQPDDELFASNLQRSFTQGQMRIHITLQHAQQTHNLQLDDVPANVINSTAIQADTAARLAAAWPGERQEAQSLTFDE